MNLVEAVKAAGIVGAGGAGFPTHMKIDTQAECFIVNAAECEPLIEVDKFLCRTFPDQIVEAVSVLSDHLGAKRRVIALKGKYEAEIEALRGAIGRANAEIEIFEMATFYPAGDEQTMVQQVCGRSVSERGIPIEVGVVVDNVGTMLNIYGALHDQAVTDKYLSVVGAVREPIVLHVPIGTAVSACIEAAVPQIREYAIILGGPMMGRVVKDPAEIAKAVVTKTTGNILVLPRNHYLIERSEKPIERIKVQAKSACIQCRMCTDLCPRYLIGHSIRPHLVMRNLFREEELETDDAGFTRAFGDAMNCCDCGICEMFACPMGLSPRKVNGYMKGRLREKGIKVERNMQPTAREMVDLHHVPTGRLVARLNLMEYYNQHAHTCTPLAPAEVYIPFSQHIGRPAVCGKQVGDTVRKGELLAAAAEGGPSANIHVSLDGVITEIDERGARISRKEV